MENLFDFATKELSQDAFIRWFLESYKDNTFRPIIADFINYFSIGQEDGRNPFNISPDDIIEIKTYSQVNDIDVSIDIWLKNIDGHRTIVIEDKTSSQEHHQLSNYNDSIAGWKYENGLTPKQCVYKVFYKTHRIGKEELKRIDAAGWTPFGIREIYDFFIKYKSKTDSDILNDYIDHIDKIYNSYSSVSEELASKWSPINWETFFNDFMDSNYKDVETNFTSYRGMYSSMIVYFDIPKKKYLTYLAFEIIIRGELLPYLHPGLHVGDRWEWSINALDESKELEECKKELNDLRMFVESFKSPIIKRSNTARSFAKIDESIAYSNMKTKELSQSLSKWIDELKNIINAYNKEKSDKRSN